MAISFAGGTDALNIDMVNLLATDGCLSFRMKTTQTTVNACVAAWWSATSRQGVGFIINNTANKLLCLSYGGDASTNGFVLTTSASINDGNEHIILLNYSRTNGQPYALYVDGTLVASGNSANPWTGAGGSNFIFGRVVDAFWPSYVGEISEVACWFRRLDTDEIDAIMDGVSPGLIGLAERYSYTPCVRGVNDLRGHSITLTGTSVAQHGRVFDPRF